MNPDALLVRTWYLWQLLSSDRPVWWTWATMMRETRPLWSRDGR